MVDFERLLGKEKIVKSIDPLVIFNDLDKEPGKETLWPVQEAVLKDWNIKLREKKDVIVKLHTGQGKTLIGLLILQSLLHEGKGPALYLCPNNYLVEQTIKQASEFHIKATRFEESSTAIPTAFRNSEAILVANCNKLFNGRSVFGVLGSTKSIINVGAIVIDDAHKCLDVIREAFTISVNRDLPEGGSNSLYKQLWGLFEETMKKQALGTTMDIFYGGEGYIAVPYWAWYDRRKEVVKILSEYKIKMEKKSEQPNELTFVWDLIKNVVDSCTCIFTSRKLEITPRILPLEQIPSFSDAQNRIFLSATLTEDALLIRDFNITKETITNPLTWNGVKYSGERLIIVPKLVDLGLSRKYIIEWLTNYARKSGDFGIVSIVPSFYRSKDWRDGIITDVALMYGNINVLKVKVANNDAKEIIVLINQYDGVDLPGSTCRILCLDSLPSYSSLIDSYEQNARPTASIIRRKTAQRVEQGMGRAIRGTSAWCIVIIIGDDLVDFLSENEKRKYFSSEVQMQIKIGETLANEMKSEGPKIETIEKLISQCLKRDLGWKEYYKSRMSEVEINPIHQDYIDRAFLERQAEIAYQQGNADEVCSHIQRIISSSSDDKEKGWYLQLLGMYLYPFNTTEAMDRQIKAFSLNNRLFRPEMGITYSKLNPVEGQRISLILDWIKRHDNYTSMCLEVENILEQLSFTVSSDLFEEKLNELGKILGLFTQRPEKESGSGPDNLWHILGKRYWIIECKSMVASNRNISKYEVSQLNTSIAWFKFNYPDKIAEPILFHPSNVLDEDAYLTDPSWVIRQEKLELLKTNVNAFFKTIKDVYASISHEIINQKLGEHHLSTDDLTTYCERVERSP